MVVQNFLTLKNGHIIAVTNAPTGHELRENQMEITKEEFDLLSKIPHSFDNAGKGILLFQVVEAINKIQSRIKDKENA